VPPYVGASSDRLDFGEHIVGTSDQRTIFLINQGEVPLTLELPRYDSLNDVFGAQLDGFTVDPDKDVVLAIRFRPSHAEVYSTTISIANNSSNRPDLKLLITGIGINAGPCDGVTCRSAPPPTCVSQDTTRRYEPLGICNETTGRCDHNFNDDACVFGCDDTTGACRGDPCTGLSCTTPPNSCYLANGVCMAGACHFETNNAAACDDASACTTGDHCAEGTCLGTTKTCTTAPEAFCVDASTRRAFMPQGTCNPANGACEYNQQDQRCDFGCTPGGCVGDPCAGVICNTPPNSQCYAGAGTCSMGVCQYPTLAGACDDGNACTVSDMCSNGLCGGSPMVCNTPPAPDCSSATDRQVYNAAGTCNAGVCGYAATAAPCTDNNQCTTGDRCQSGMCVTSGALACNDGNSCSTDSCDPIQGCVATPSSGNACTTASNTCPTGSCSGGNCLAVPNINCQAEYSLCFGLQDVDVPGRCSASGQCVVTQPPPQFTCPGCNGLCIQCFGAQLCIPF